VTSTPAPIEGTWERIVDLPRYINAWAIDPEDSRLAFAGCGQTGSGSGVFRSEDGGATWTSASEGLPDRDVVALALGPGHPRTLYASVSGDIYASQDAGASWKRLGSAADDSGGQALVVSPDGKTLVQIAQGAKALRSRDGGRGWQPVRGGLPGDAGAQLGCLAFDPMNSMLLYAGTTGNGVYRSTDGGGRWTPINRDMLGTSIRSIAVDPRDPRTLYAGASEATVFKSTDSGGTWRSLQDEIKAAGAEWVPGNIRLALDPRHGGAIYLLGDQAGLLYSGDGGETWSALAKPGQSDQPSFTAFAAGFGSQPVLLAAIDRGGGGWRYSEK
jgi:photosystem II stability/assembly factor-like uncharacterized protein